MSLPATDNFNRADSGTLGANWTTLANALAILSNQAVSDGSLADGAEYWNVDVFPDDQYSQVVLPNLSTDLQGPIVRGASSQYYGARATVGGTIETFKFVSGTLTSIHTTAALTVAAGDTLKLQVVGISLTVYVNGVQVDFMADGSLLSGSAGVYATGKQIGGAGSMDSWEGGSAATAVTTAQELPAFIGEMAGGAMVGQVYGKSQRLSIAVPQGAQQPVPQHWPVLPHMQTRGRHGHPVGAPGIDLRVPEAMLAMWQCDRARGIRQRAHGRGFR